MAADAGGGGGSGGGAGGSQAGSGGAGGSGAPCAKPIPAGNAASVAVGSLTIVGGNVVLGRDATGLYAMSAVCTHQGCIVNVVGAPSQPSLSCPCHGSRFSSNGDVTVGPARLPLPHFEVEVAADGGVTVCPATQVASSSRTPA